MILLLRKIDLWGKSHPKTVLVFDVVSLIGCVGFLLWRRH